MGSRLSAASLPLLLGMALAAGGCSKHQPVAGTNSATNADLSPSTPGAPYGPRGSAPAPPPPAAAVIADSGDVNATLSQLSLELRKYVVRTHIVPKDFDDFIARSRVQAPPPPAGKKYAIQAQAIVLVKR
jgi:hypothetical protein